MGGAPSDELRDDSDKNKAKAKPTTDNTNPTIDPFVG
jgi:hypothetical protein